MPLIKLLLCHPPAAAPAAAHPAAPSTPAIAPACLSAAAEDEERCRRRQPLQQCCWRWRCWQLLRCRCQARSCRPAQGPGQGPPARLRCARPSAGPPRLAAAAGPAAVHRCPAAGGAPAGRPVQRLPARRPGGPCRAGPGGRGHLGQERRSALPGTGGRAHTGRQAHGSSKGAIHRRRLSVPSPAAPAPQAHQRPRRLWAAQQVAAPAVPHACRSTKRQAAAEASGKAGQRYAAHRHPPTHPPVVNALGHQREGGVQGHREAQGLQHALAAGAVQVAVAVVVQRQGGAGAKHGRRGAHGGRGREQVAGQGARHACAVAGRAIAERERQGAGGRTAPRSAQQAAPTKEAAHRGRAAAGGAPAPI
jgi:hypothetical protein